MPAMPESKHSTASKIYEWYAAKPQDHRDHLGASLIGHECDRYLWMTFRWAAKPEFEGRILRLFNTGVREEDRIHKELRGIGVDLYVEENGKQITCRDETGHFGGSVDGVGKGFPEAPKAWAVLECKTHSAKSFADLQKKGVKESKPRHYAQMQVYMGLLKLERALYFAVNKDTDELHTEWVHFEESDFDALLARAKRTIEATEPPPKLSDDPAYWQCKGCDFYAQCHQQRVALANCRTCCHASPVAKGGWHCGLHNKKLTGQEQREGCGQHIFIPPLVPFGKPIDGGEAHVVYEHVETGRMFTNGAGGYSSKELSVCVAGIVTDRTVEAMRSIFKAQVTESQPTPRKRKRGGVDLSNLPPPPTGNEDVPFDDPIPF